MKNDFLFPKYDVKVVKNERKKYEVTLFSIIHLHYPVNNRLYIYEYPVESTYIVNRQVDKEEAIRLHLKECFVLSKYMIVNDDNTDGLHLVTVLDMKAYDFERKLHELFP